MGVYSHRLLKENNSFILLHSLYVLKSATMFDLVKETHLSQSSVRNLLRQFEEEKIVKSIGIDQSTGGRCPIRFSLVTDTFLFLCCYVHKDSIDYQIIELYETIDEGQIHYSDYAEVIEQVKILIDKYALQCLVIAVEGIVDGQYYYTDHENQYNRNIWIEELQQHIHIPIYIENDVKAMQQGIYKDNEALQNFVYLYINELGMACSIMMNGKLLKGTKGILGELGLLPYEDITINQALRHCKNQESFNQLLIYLLTIICTSIDPEKILISSELSYDIDIEYFHNSLQKKIYQSYQLECLDKPIQKLFGGLEYIGIKKILKKKIGEEK